MICVHHLLSHLEVAETPNLAVIPSALVVYNGLSLCLYCLKDELAATERSGADRAFLSMDTRDR